MTIHQPIKLVRALSPEPARDSSRWSARRTITFIASICSAFWIGLGLLIWGALVNVRF